MPTQTGPGIVAEPYAATIDVARRIFIRGFAPGERVTVTATLRQNDASRWRSEASFVADTDGAVDIATAAPVGGTYEGVAPMGLVWSMRQTGEPLPPGTPFDQLAVQTVHLAASAPSGTAHASFEQHFVAPGVTVQPIRDNGLVATLFTAPAAD